MVGRYKELVAWQKGTELVRSVYALVREFPKTEQYRLVSQLTGAAVSVPSNSTERFGRSTNKDFSHFVSQARGSLFEIETQLQIATDLSFVSSIDKEMALAEELGKVLNGLIRSRSSNSQPPIP